MPVNIFFSIWQGVKLNRSATPAFNVLKSPAQQFIVKEQYFNDSVQIILSDFIVSKIYSLPQNKGMQPKQGIISIQLVESGCDFKLALSWQWRYCLILVIRSCVEAFTNEELHQVTPKFRFKLSWNPLSWRYQVELLYCVIEFWTSDNGCKHVLAYLQTSAWWSSSSNQMLCGSYAKMHVRNRITLWWNCSGTQGWGMHHTIFYYQMYGIT